MLIVKSKIKCNFVYIQLSLFLPLISKYLNHNNFQFQVKEFENCIIIIDPLNS